MTIIDRLERITTLDAGRAVECPPPPSSVKIELTSRCDLGCGYCARRNSGREHGDMGREEYSRIIRDLRGAGVEQLGVFYLGESTLVPWLPEAVAEAKGLGFRNVFLTTNGTRLDSRLSRELMEAGLDSLKFSLNYANEAQMAEIAHCKPGVFDVVDTNVIASRGVRDAGGYATEINACYIAYDVEQEGRMAARVERLRPFVDQWYAMPLYSQGGQVYGRVLGNTGMAHSQKPPVPCWVVFAQGHIDHMGNLTMCCFDHDGHFQVGNLLETPFMELWHSERFRDLRRRHIAEDVRNTRCESCIHGTTYNKL